MSKKKKEEASKPEEAKKAEKDHKEEIKEMERKKRDAAHKAAAAKPVPPQGKEVSFDEWYMMRSAAIPKNHRKEMLRADFKGRGLGSRAELAQYDDALCKYGVKLKK